MISGGPGMLLRTAVASPGAWWRRSARLMMWGGGEEVGWSSL